MRGALLLGILAACTVTVGPPATIPRPVEAATPTMPPCDLEPDCGPGCFDLSTESNRACVDAIPIPPRGGGPPRFGESVVETSTIRCEHDDQCAIVSVPGCPCPACPAVVAVGSRIPRSRTCRTRVSCTPCARAPSIARCEQGRCVGVVPTISVTY